MKTMSKKLISIATTVAVSVSVLSSFASVNAATISKENIVEKATVAETRGKYATNPNGVGKEKTITIDGDASDWSDDMLIAQGAAWDIANNWKGGHENCVLDSYALYAAWDDDNLYIGWQMVNTTDTWAREGDGPLSDGGRVLDVPLVIALNVGNKTAMNGKMANGKLLWDALQIEYETRVDHLFLMSGKVGLGTPAMFTAADESGGTSYDAEYCQSFKDIGVKYNMAETSIPAQIWGLESSTSPDDVYSDSANWVDMMTKGHDRKYDSFYEMSIPLSVLGIDKNYITSNGIGVMQLSTRGISAIDCLPHDPSMLDNATGDCAVDPSTSHEKDDTDIITVPLAQVGNNGGVTPPPVSQGTVKVQYVDEEGNEIATSKTMTGKVGDSYTTSAVSVSGYTLKTTPNNASGTYKSGTTTVTYVYSKNSDVSKGTVKVQYVDEDGNEIASSRTMTGEVGTSYTTTAKTIAGYTLKTTPNNASGTYKNGTITVTYVYSKDNDDVDKGTVIVKYVDENGNEIASSTTKTGEVGTSYTTTAKTISGYTLKTTPSNAKGTFKNGTIIVTYSYTKASTVVAPIVSSFTTDKQSPQVTGTQVKLTAKATGTGTLKYKFLIKDAAGNWAVLRDYGTSNTYTWTTKATGNKTLYVDVKDSNGKVTRKAMSYTVKEAEKPKVVSFAADKKSPQASGTEVTLSAAASGTGVLQYKFLVKDNTTGNWSVIRDYSILNSCTWKANKVGNKTLYVDVKDTNGQVTRKSMSYTVKAVPPTVSSFTVDKKSPQASGTQVKLTAKATGTGTLQYKFLIKDAAGNWSVLRDYGTSNTYTWTTKATGNKTLYVDVKDSNGQVTRKSMNYVVNANLVQDTDSKISYTGTWKVATSTKHSGGTCKYASSTATATYKFTGTGIKLIASKSSDKGIAKVTVDSKVYYIDLYSASAKDQSVAFSLSGLTSGTHTIKVEWTGLKNNSSKGNAITLDAFEIN